MNENTKKIIELSDGTLSSSDIAELVRLSPRYVRKVMKKFDLPRLNEGAQHGKNNHQFQHGRHICLDGYVLVKAPPDHPFARKRVRLILEHRLVMEKKIGRYLQPQEIVDHIDELTLHNHPDNLRLFASNADHLKATLSGKPIFWSKDGYQNIGARTDLGIDISPVDSYRQRKASGDVRLRQILLAALSLGTDSPYLLGSFHHTSKAGIDLSSYSKIERALADLYARWGVGHAR